MTNAHKQLVRVVMDSLASSMGDEGVSEDELPICPAAVEIVANILSQDWLLFNNQVRLVESVTRDDGNGGYSHNNLLVTIVPDSNGLRCQWCANPYGTGDPGGGHGLCKNCYTYGPSKSNDE